MESSDLRVSIDRLTVVADDHMFLSPVSFPSNWDGLYSLGNGVYQVVATDLESDVSENIAYINFYDFGKDSSGVRVDFNPNRRLQDDIDAKYWKTLDKVLMGMIGKKRLSRIDIAFDDFASRMSNYFYFKPGVTKKFFGRDGDVETYYYGSSLSDRQIRQYNKQRERLKKGIRSDEWWRLEIQLRTKYISEAGEQIADMLSWFRQHEWEWIDDFSDQMMMVALDSRPEYYARLSKQKKARVNRYRKEAPNGDLVDDMLLAYEQQKNNLEAELARYLAAYDVVF